MTRLPGGQLLDRLRRVLSKEAECESPDADLLDRFRRHADADAFGLLVQRHGGMVWELCQSLLQQRQDAEDVFQATFLVLAHKAESLRRPEALAGWLHGVAFRLAQKLRRHAYRHPARTGASLDQVPARPMEDLTWRELRQALHEELNRLPERHRLPLVLCHLEGLTQDEAAQTLGWTAGQLRGRLLRGRELLRVRLVRRGLAPAVPLLAVVLSQGDALAGLPQALTDALLSSVKVCLTDPGAGGPGVAQPLRLARAYLQRATAFRVRLLLGAVLVLCLTASALAWVAGSTAGLPLSPAATESPRAPDLLLIQQDKAQERQLAHVDRLGDPLPPEALIRLGTLRFRTAGFIGSLIFSPDGKTLICGGWDPKVRCWTVADGKEASTLDGPAKGLGILALAADGKRLVGAGMDGNLHIWDFPSGRKVRQHPVCIGSLECLAMTPDGRRAVLAGRDKVARFWDLDAGKELRTLGTFQMELNSVAVSPDGTLAVLSSYEQNIRVVDTATGQQLYRLHPWAQAFYCADFSPDGRTLLTGETGAVCRREARTGKLLRRTSGLSGHVYAVHFAPDGKTYATGSHQTVQTWDTATGKELHRYEGHTDSIRALAFSPDGRLLATGCNDCSVHIWDAVKGGPMDPIPGHQERVTDVAFAPDGRTVVTAAWDRTLRLWDVHTGGQLQKLEWPRTKEDLVNRTGYVRGVAFCPSGKYLAAAIDNNKVLLWRLPGTRPTLERTGSCVSFSPDGRQFATGGNDGIVRLYEIKTGQEVRQFRGHLSPLKWVGFAPDGQTLVTASYGAGFGLQMHEDEKAIKYDKQTIWLWDVATGQEKRRLGGPQFPGAVAFSPDGRMLAATGGRAEKTIQLWELATGQLRCELKGHEDYLLTLAFSPDGRFLASGSMENTIRLWQLPFGTEVHRLRGHRAWVQSVAFAPDSQTLVSGSLDTTGLIWKVPRVPAPAVVALSPARWQELWKDLAHTDARQAYKAICTLTAAGANAVPRLDQVIKPAMAPDPARVPRLIRELDHPKFAVREKAVQELAKLGTLVAPDLRKVLDQPAPLEVTQRVEKLLEKLAGEVLTPDAQRDLRAVEALEYIGTPLARQLLSRLGQGAPGARLTREARAALGRLAVRRP